MGLVMMGDDIAVPSTVVAMSIFDTSTKRRGISFHFA
jgi:hypothetical protein